MIIRVFKKRCITALSESGIDNIGRDSYSTGVAKLFCSRVNFQEIKALWAAKKIRLVFSCKPVISQFMVILSKLRPYNRFYIIKILLQGPQKNLWWATVWPRLHSLRITIVIQRLKVISSFGYLWLVVMRIK